MGAPFCRGPLGFRLTNLLRAVLRNLGVCEFLGFGHGGSDGGDGGLTVGIIKMDTGAGDAAGADSERFAIESNWEQIVGR